MNLLPPSHAYAESYSSFIQFTDFWLGCVLHSIIAWKMAVFDEQLFSDQFCSLVFSLSNIYFLCCVYADGYGFDSDWRKKCASSSPRWPVPFVLTVLPLIVRLVQSIRRYVDSKLTTHLINVRFWLSFPFLDCL